MQTLANAILDLAAFIERSDDETINPDAAVKALEDLAATLSAASPSEISAVLAAAAARAAAATSPAEEMFWSGFAEAMGLSQTPAQ
jgi:hypothetical protein